MAQSNEFMKYILNRSTEYTEIGQVYIEKINIYIKRDKSICIFNVLNRHGNMPLFKLWLPHLMHHIYLKSTMLNLLCIFVKALIIKLWNLLQLLKALKYPPFMVSPCNKKKKNFSEKQHGLFFFIVDLEVVKGKWGS